MMRFVFARAPQSWCFEWQKEAYSPFLGLYVLSSGMRTETHSKTFCLFQFSIKLICDANCERVACARKKNITKPSKTTRFLCWGIFTVTEPNWKIHGQRCKICFTLKVGSHNSYNTISKWSENEKANIDSGAESHRSFDVFFHSLSLFVCNLNPLLWMCARATEKANENNKYFEIA